MSNELYEANVKQVTGTPESRMLLGASYLSSIALGENPNATVMLLDVKRFNMVQQDIGEFLFFRETGNFATDSEQDQAKVKALALEIADRYRTLLQHAINSQERIREQEKLREFQNLVQSQKENQKPSEMGTVAEIAAKYGVSKSEVRRLKVQGALHTLEKKNGSE